MEAPPLRRLRLSAGALLLLAACTDNPVAPPAPDTAEPRTVAALSCEMNVAAGTLLCTRTDLPSDGSGARKDLTVGGQGVYVQLASSGTSYDAGTEIAQTNVTVQNLLRQALGTPDGVTVSGVKVVFTGDPVVTSGTGIVTVANPDGTGDFTSTAQPYFLYPEKLDPYQISNARTWMFSVPSTVNSFRFSVFVVAPVSEGVNMLLDRVWTGAADSLWENGANWQGGIAPDSASVVVIPPDSTLTTHRMPVLSADARVAHLRVGFGSTLDLQGFILEASGNVDAVGAILGGTVRMTGSGALLRGSVNALQVTGGTSLQGAARASGAVSVRDGSLAVRDQALSIQLP
jgi:hypothetical protein